MLSDEEKKEYEELKSLLYTGTISQYGKRKLIDMFEKQQKEIEELKKNNETQPDCAEPIERTEEMVNMRWVNHNYILKTESEQRERKAYIKGTNDADELCNKKWEDKIKEKIEEVHYKMIGHQDLREAVKQALQSLLEKE
ncbi:MAG: hypothetical protein IJK18_08220 [Clostridia bacterium]|nr:hypothetical protein [Clostridia bacterium]